MLVLFDHRCRECNTVFEDLVLRDGPKTANCPECKGLADRQLGAVRLDPRMGLDPAFPTMADKWADRRLQHQRIEERRNREHGD
jgi:putative FmdB family regulatory protein